MFKRWFKPHDRVALDATVLILTYDELAADVACKRSEKALNADGQEHWDLVARAIKKIQTAQAHAA